MLPAGRHSCRFDHTAHGIVVPDFAWPSRTACRKVLALFQRTLARRGSWTRLRRSCPRAYPLDSLDQSRGPSLPRRYSAPGSSVPWPPRTPAELRSLSPSAYTSGLALTRAVQSGLPHPVHDLEHVLLPLPRWDLRRLLSRIYPPTAWPSPPHDRLGSHAVTLSRLQVSLYVAARVLAPSFRRPEIPHSAFGFPHAGWGLLPSAPSLARTGLAPAGYARPYGVPSGIIYTTTSRCTIQKATIWDLWIRRRDDSISRLRQDEL